MVKTITIDIMGEYIAERDSFNADQDEELLWEEIKKAIKNGEVEFSFEIINVETE